MNTRYVPAIVMLSAGLIVCLFGIYNHLSLFDFTMQLLIVLVIFLIIGSLVKFVLDITFNRKETTEEDTESTEEFESEDLEEINSEEDQEDTTEEN